MGQWAWNGGAWQQWRFVDVGGGYVRIESLDSGKCLDVTGRSTADGALLEQRTCGDGNAFLWSRT